MRKVMGVVLASAMVLGGMILAGPAGAAGGTTCKTATGTAKFNPALPILTSKSTVFDILTASGTVSGCSGGGVTGGTTKVSFPKGKTGSSCTTIATSKTPTTGGTETITWNTKATSTISLTLSSVAGKGPTVRSVTGTVTAGLFKGLHQSGQVTYTLPSGACSKTPLSSVKYNGTSPLVLK